MARRNIKKNHRFNTQPPEGGWLVAAAISTPTIPFQHTAARRRLVLLLLFRPHL